MACEAMFATRRSLFTIVLAATRSRVTFCGKIDNPQWGAQLLALVMSASCTHWVITSDCKIEGAMVKVKSVPACKISRTN
jgi:hypothetical protein